MMVSVIVCTYNRASHILSCLQSLSHQEDAGEYEVIVVDNNSTDRTGSLVRGFIEGRGSFRYYLEKEPGLSVARNKGIELARGAIVAFIDDDAIADRVWVRSIRQSLSHGEHKIACVFGPVDLDWGGEKPNWFPDRYLEMYTYLRRSESRHIIESGNVIVQGANMAFLKTGLLQVGRFDANLGRKGRDLLSGEESWVVKKLLNAGYMLEYHPAMHVKHSILPERRRISYLVKRVFADGRTQVLIDLERGYLSRTTMKRRALYDAKLFMVELAGQLRSIALRLGDRSALDALLILTHRVGRLRMILKHCFR